MANIDAKFSNGNLSNIELIRIILINNKEFVLYTMNEATTNGLIKVYASLKIKNNDQIEFNNVDDNDWTLIKDAMRKLLANEPVNFNSTMEDIPVVINGNRIIAVTPSQKESIIDKNLIINKIDNTLSGISDIGTLDTEAPVSLNALNNEPVVNNFVDNTAPSNTNMFVDNNLNNQEVNIPSVNNQVNSQESFSPFANIEPNPGSINDIFNQGNSNIQQNAEPVINSIPESNQSVVEPVVNEPITNTTNFNDNQPVIDSPMSSNISNNDDLDKLIKIAKNNLESAKIIYDNLVNYKNKQS